MHPRTVRSSSLAGGLYTACSNLHVLEGLLRSGIEPLGILVDGGDVVVVLDDSMNVLVELELHELATPPVASSFTSTAT